MSEKIKKPFVLYIGWIIVLYIFEKVGGIAAILNHFYPCFNHYSSISDCYIGYDILIFDLTIGIGASLLIISLKRKIQKSFHRN